MSDDLVNPNEYDDDAFIEASNDLQGNLADAIDKLWAAGCSVKDIESELANATENAEFATGKNISVEIHIN